MTTTTDYPQRVHTQITVIISIGFIVLMCIAAVLCSLICRTRSLFRTQNDIEISDDPTITPPNLSSLLKECEIDEITDNTTSSQFMSLKSVGVFEYMPPKALCESFIVKNAEFTRSLLTQMKGHFNNDDVAIKTVPFLPEYRSVAVVGYIIPEDKTPSICRLQLQLLHDVLSLASLQENLQVITYMIRKNVLKDTVVPYGIVTQLVLYTPQFNNDATEEDLNQLFKAIRLWSAMI